MTSRQFLGLEILCVILAIVSFIRGDMFWALVGFGFAALCEIQQQERL